MDLFKPTLFKLLRFIAGAFALYRLATSSNSGHSAIKGLMVSIAAFAAHKTLDLLIPTKPVDDD